jgi:hypothetical protein
MKVGEEEGGGGGDAGGDDDNDWIIGMITTTLRMQDLIPKVEAMQCQITKQYMQQFLQTNSASL